jgi:hypothetical protein
VQYLLLARAHGIRPLVAVPGTQDDAETALALGADVIPQATPRVIETLRPDVVVVDDPVAAQTGSWIITAQRAGVLVVSNEDLGIVAPQAAPATLPMTAAVANAMQGARRAQAARG